MKLSIRLLLALSVIVSAFAGCAKTSDIENIQEQIDTMKSDQIGSIESQIESIRKSIASLEATDTALHEYINALQDQITSLESSEEDHSEEIEALRKAVEALQEKDEDLQEQINALKEYVDSLISDTKEWANATFATIEQYNSASEIIADIKAQIEAINLKLASSDEIMTDYESVVASINDSLASMKLDIETLQKQMTAILAQIQSVSYIPNYSDGKAVMTYYTDSGIIAGSATLDFEIKPATVAAKIATVWSADSSILSMKAVYTITKTPSVVDLGIESVTSDGGCLSVTISGKSLKDEFFKSQCSASVRLGITDGNNDITSEYVQIVPWNTAYILFPDSKFKTYCVDNFDEDADGRVSIAEAQAVTRIECANSDIFSLSGIVHFCNLEYVDASCNRLTSLDLSLNPKLKKVKVNDNKLQTLDLTGLLDLESLDCSNNELDNINVDDYVRLDTLDCAGNNITSLNVDNNANLVFLNCSSNKLVDIDVQKNTVLKNLNVSFNPDITMLVLKNNTRLETLDASKTGLISLDTSANKALQYLNVSSTSLAALDVLNNTSLETLKVSRTVKLIVSEGLNSSIYQIGQYVSIAGVAGVVCSASSSVAKIMSTTETYTYWDYYGTTTGATSEDDGVANTDKIASGSPAVRWCRSLGAEWYLPATEELSTIYNNKSTLNTTLPAIGGTTLSSNLYWSSTEYYSNSAYLVNFLNGSVYNYPKSFSNYVRAVRAL